MIIINADDWGRSRSDTDAARACFAKGRITSVSAMVFMQDSERAAMLAKEAGLAVGLHLNLDEPFTSGSVPQRLVEQQQSIARFLNRIRFALLLYNPLLVNKLKFVYETQVAEFTRLYGRQPTHLDGHHHLHLCSNMLMSSVIPPGFKVRRSFSFWPGEKSWVNRVYRSAVYRWLRQRYVVTDYFFSLGQCLENKRMERVAELAKRANVELMTHPAVTPEYGYLQSDECVEWLKNVWKGSYAEL